MQTLSIRDQIIVCVTDAVNCANRELEPTAKFGLTHKNVLQGIAIHRKGRLEEEVMVLNVGYRVDGTVANLSFNIPIQINEGKIDYGYVRSELIKIIPHQMM